MGLPQTSTEATVELATLLPIGKVAKFGTRPLMYLVEKMSFNKLLKFTGDEAIRHFGDHAGQIMKVLGKKSYNLKEYISDANWIVANGTYSSKLNDYFYYMGNLARGSALFGFVGLKKAGASISTFHIKTAKELGL